MRIVLVGTVATAALFVAGIVLLAEEEKSKPEGADAAAMFQQLDTNKDGQLTDDEVPAEKKRIFERLLRIADKDHDGRLTAEEFAAGLKDDGPARSSGPSAANDEQAGRDWAKQRFKQLDANGDGRVTLDEVPEPRRERFARLLERGDKNGDKALSEDEFADAIRQFGGPGGGDQGGHRGERMFKFLDKNGDGKVTLDETPTERREFFERLIARGDKNDDKALSMEEFTEAMRQFGGEFGRGGHGRSRDGGRPEEGGRFRGGPPPGIGLFRALDTDHDGKLNKAEIDAASEVLRKLDRDSDGNVTPREIFGDGPPGRESRPDGGEKSPGTKPE